MGLCTCKDAPHHVTTELRIKATMSYHYTPIRMLKYKTLTTPNAGEDVEQQVSFVSGENAKWHSCLEDGLSVSYQTTKPTI